MIARDEKVSQVRLTAGAVRHPGHLHDIGLRIMGLQVVQSDMYASLAEKNRVRNVPILRLAARFWIAKAAPSSRTILRLRLCCYAILPATSRRRAPHCPGSAPRRKRCQRSHPAFRCDAQYQPIFLKDDITQDELPLLSHHRQTNCPSWIRSLAHRRLYPPQRFMAILSATLAKSAKKCSISRAGSSTIPATSGKIRRRSCNTTKF